MRNYKIIISGGGTGGHVFPAIAIASEITRRFPDSEILFVGAEGRMEMARVPAAGYKIVGLPVSGFHRASLLKNFSVVAKLIKSLRMAKQVIRKFNPDIAVGVGGYASGPSLWMASSLNIPIVIQEQNSYAGLTNKLLGRKASKICVAYRNMDKFFPAERLVITGNPVRKDLETVCDKNTEVLDYFRLEPNKPVLLVLGGSLGARTINKGLMKGLKSFAESGVQIIWQTGESYYETIKKEFEEEPYEGLWYADFILRMDYAYAAADLVVSRAGAGTISELCLLKKPVILVPSPNVAEDHQKKNALALSENNAARMIPDHQAEEKLSEEALKLLQNKEQLNALSENISLFAQHNSAARIVDEIQKIIKSENEDK